MAPPDQETLRKLWRDAPEGRLCAWEVAKAIGLREANKEIHGGAPNLPWIAERLTKVGGGSPSTPSLHELFAKMDADEEWFPGKHSGAKRGPKPVFNGQKRRCVALSMMAAKQNEGLPPCTELAVQRCPDATFNPRTGKPFNSKTIRSVFTTDCYDFDPEFPWVFQAPLQKVWLPEDLKQHRCDMAKYIRRYGKSPQWWAQHVLWFDPCSSIVPGSQQQYDHMRQALKGSKQYISDDAKLYSGNMKGKSTALKQITWTGTKINWFMVLARDVVHVEVMPADWSLSGKGWAQCVDRLPGVLRKMLGPTAPLPRNVFTDRGTGMYTPQGKVVREYAAAIDRAGFSLYWGDDAQRQSPDMGDLLLHETAVAWFRKRMRAERPEVVPWEETPVQWTKRARKVVASINQEYDVAGLCREFPQRLRDVVDSEGERLRK